MKVIECGSNRQTEEKSGESILNRLRSERRKQSADEIFIQGLRNVLDNRFIILCEICLEGRREVFPLVLIGPTGIWVISTSDTKGIYKVIDGVWEELDGKTGGYKPVKPNLMTEVIEKTALLTSYFMEQGFEVPPIEPVVFFSNPGAHAETNHPAARIVLIDALGRFIATILATPVCLEGESVQTLVGAIYCEQEPLAPISDLRDAYSLSEPPPPEKPREPSRLEEISREEPKIVGRLSRGLPPLSRRQWILVGLLIVVNIIILLALVLVVVIST